ncbi:hypothetical protein K432DRAFT_290584 [Lepidopterella palustris CBS 459.81]|uniref:Glycosyltransferase 2 n=1 Tax=Lepidopterella palustris CBS 459.81 TaxID=1314670 RepID=A0A8E2JIC7_9PEZI|nr:hypothetical protein K432DRAFT_290584 [Lepidopterella palustris CBS 459.81]
MISRTIFPSDEELGKRDDDHKPRRAPLSSILKAPLRWRKRRILLTLVGIYLLYVFIHNIATDSGKKMGRVPGSKITVPIGRTTLQTQTEPVGPPPGIKSAKDEAAPPPQTYNGQVRFYKLAVSLHGAATTLGWRHMNRNVLFAISSLKSASVLLPMVCEMARWNRNYVHVAFMGRDAIQLDDLLEINGIDKEKCDVYWHDARADYSEYSSNIRAEGSVAAAMNHIHSFLHPQVAIIDDTVQEDAFFVRGMRAKAKEQNLPIIEIPKDGSENFMWITRLDSGSLRSWHQATIDILIHAPLDSSGSLIRLFKSIQRADYTGLKPPRLIVELPTSLDPPTQQYLEHLEWPPSTQDSPLASNEIVLRHRISSQRTSPEEASIRFLESFYPANPASSHVLLLSPQAQLSPLYYHYLKYNLLEFKYSSYSADQSGNLLGISLDLPPHLLDGISPLKAPRPADMNNAIYHTTKGVSSVPFLWQAPNSNAALYFGDKWIELHSFLTSRMAAEHLKSKTAPRAKIVSEFVPAWMEYVLEFMRTRGYSLLYPGTISGENLVTIHNELYHLPEEFMTPSTPKEKGMEAEPPELTEQPFLTDASPPAPPDNYEPPLVPPSRPLHSALPFDGDLPEIPHLPYLLHTGESLPPENVTIVAETFATKFRLEVGGCKPVPEGKRRKIIPGSARDLFCSGDDNENDFEDEDAIPNLDPEARVNPMVESKKSSITPSVSPIPTSTTDYGVRATKAAA